jgi:acetyl esterase
MLDATASFESYTLNGMDYVITRDTLLSGYEMYLAGADRKHPEASPLWREDFSGLPVHILPLSTIRYAMKAKRCINA